MYKRPSVRTRPPPRSEFVTEIRPNGTRVSTWVQSELTPTSWTGQEGRVGEIITAMHRGVDYANRPPQTEWCPSYDYEFIAKHMDEKEAAAYIAKCRAWCDAHPPPVPVVRENPVYDQELINALFAKYSGQVPPFEERIAVYKAAGVPEAYIEYAQKRQTRFLEKKEEAQAAIDRMFPNVKTITKKAAPKIIKAVKKRM